MAFSRQGFWSGCHLLLQGILPTQGLNPDLLCLLALAGGLFTTEPPGKPHVLELCVNTCFRKNFSENTTLVTHGLPLVRLVAQLVWFGMSKSKVNEQLIPK